MTAKQDLEQELRNTLTWYINSPFYRQDLLATHTIWMRPGMLGQAGMFLFLSYITIPLLLQVQPGTGPARSATIKPGLLREQEKRFLQRVLGLSEEASWTGGIANLRIRGLISGLRQRHLGFAGMRQNYLDFFAEIIALAPGRICASTHTSIDASTGAAYWRYMTYVCALFGASLGTETVASRRCQDFIDHYTHPTAEGQKMFVVLEKIYPVYIQQAIPALFPATRLAVQWFQEEV